MSKVSIVVVSHSAPLAQAAVELATQMVESDPPTIKIAAGTADGELGTDATAVQAAIEQVRGQAGVAVFVDLGSAIMSAEMAVEMLEEGQGEVRILAPPLVEGLVAAAVSAAGGASLEELASEAAEALAAKRSALGEADPQPSTQAPAEAESTPGEAKGSAKVINKVGLHARPAAKVAALAGKHDAELLIGVEGKDKQVKAKSALGLMSLGAEQGTTLTYQATGPDAQAVVDALTQIINEGFGEE